MLLKKTWNVHIMSKNSDLIENFPYLICQEHLARTKIKNIFGYKKVVCRIDKNCVKYYKRIIVWKYLVGRIGDFKDTRFNNDSYYVDIWNHETKEIRDGDYDIIQIHENDVIEDFDGVIVKVVSYFYNELKRFKPISEVIVKIIGQPKISESTKRLLEKRFLKVEYASNR